MKLRLNRIAAAVACLPLGMSFGGGAWAAPADTTSAYWTDPQSVYVQDQTSDGVNQLNMVLCIMNAMRPAEMLDAKGTAAPDGSVSVSYSALVDQNKCDASRKSSASNSASTSSGATAAPSYMIATVNVSRASSADPMLAKVWLDFDNNGAPVTVYVRVSASQAPTDAQPYGVFRLDYLGRAAGVQQFNGYIDAGSGLISYYETSSDGGGPRTTALTIAAASTTAGAGTMAMTGNNGGGGGSTTANFDFAYNSQYFRRSDANNDKCFDRAMSRAARSVWNYGTYDANSGARVDLSNPGFPVIATKAADGSKTYGYAGYWGINLNGVDLSALPDGLLAGYTLADQRPGHAGSYQLNKVSGKLTQWTRQSTTLGAVDGVPIIVWVNLTGPSGTSVTDNPNLIGANAWQGHWSTADGTFVITGQQSCGGTNGCVVTPVSPVGRINPTVLTNTFISGWSESLGGNVTIASTGQVHTAADPLTFYTQNVVVPGSSGAPTDLYCMSNCLTATSMGAFTGSNSPFDSGTSMQWGFGPNVVHYTYDAGGLKEGTTAMVDTNPAHFSGGMYGGGFSTGRLVSSAPGTCTPPWGGQPGVTYYCEPQDPAVYYSWSTGTQPWNQTAWLTPTGGGAALSFDPPRMIGYTVTAADDPSGVWVNRQIQLQFNGFGDLFGVPGDCVNPVDNSPATCDQPNVRYVPRFALADGATMTLPGSGGGSSTPLIVKALNAELRLSNVAASNCSAMTLSPQTVPGASGLHDPGNAADAYAIGTKPTLTSGSYAVIHGVLQ